jgi:uncharacterized protein YpuA (DUF1002 family)
MEKKAEELVKVKEECERKNIELNRVSGQLKELKTKQHQVIDSFLSDCLVPECYFCS